MFLNAVFSSSYICFSVLVSITFSPSKARVITSRRAASGTSSMSLLWTCMISLAARAIRVWWFSMASLIRMRSGFIELRSPPGIFSAIEVAIFFAPPGAIESAAPLAALPRAPGFTSPMAFPAIRPARVPRAIPMSSSRMEWSLSICEPMRNPPVAPAKRSINSCDANPEIFATSANAPEFPVADLICRESYTARFFCPVSFI